MTFAPVSPKFILSEMALAKGNIYLPSSGTTASFPASPIPTMLALFAIPPVLYQSTEICGILGGSRENSPSILKCGNLISGNSSLQLEKNLDMLSSPRLTTEPIESIFPPMVFFMLAHLFPALFLMLSHVLDMVFFMSVNLLPAVDLMLFQYSPKFIFILLHIFLAVDLTLFHESVKK